MSTDPNRNLPPASLRVISPIIVVPAGERNCTNGGGWPYVVDACQLPSVTVTARPHAVCPVNGAPCTRRSSKPTTHGPGAAGGCENVLSGTADGVAGIVGVLPQRAAPSISTTARRILPANVAMIRTPTLPF